MKYLRDISLSYDNRSQRGREVFLLQSVKTLKMHWRCPYLSWWSAPRLAVCSCKTSSISPTRPAFFHSGAEITAAWGQIPVIETLCAWNILHSNLKILQELIFSIMSPRQHNYPASLCWVQMGTAGQHLQLHSLLRWCSATSTVKSPRALICSRFLGRVLLGPGQWQPQRTGMVGSREQDVDATQQALQMGSADPYFLLSLSVYRSPWTFADIASWY